MVSTGRRGYFKTWERWVPLLWIPVTFRSFLSEGVHMSERYISTVMETIGPQVSAGVRHPLYDAEQPGHPGTRHVLIG
jgi:hypothetical protein